MNSIFRQNLLVLLIFLINLFACSKRQLIVVNQGNSSLSIVNLDDGSVVNNAGGLTVGERPNAILIDGNTAYITDSGTDESGDYVIAVDLKKLELSGKVDLNSETSSDTRCNGWESAIIDRKGYTSCFSSSEVVVWEVSSLEVSSRIALPSQNGFPASPEGIVSALDNIYTANTAVRLEPFGFGPGNISIIESSSDTVIDADSQDSNGEDTPIFTTQKNPQDIVFNLSDQKLYVVNTGDFFSSFGVIDVIDLQANVVNRSIDIGASPGVLGVNSDCNKLYVGNGTSAGLFVVDLNTGEILHGSDNPILLNDAPFNFVSSIFVLDQFVYVTTFAEKTLYEINCDTEEIRSFEVGPNPVAVGYYSAISTPER